MNKAVRLALVATVAATAFTAWKESQQAALTDAPTADVARAPARATPDAVIGDGGDPVRLLATTDLAPVAPVDLFGPRQWLRAPVAPALPLCDEKPGKASKAKSTPCAKAPEPVAPSLPFAFSGLWVEGAIRYVVLSARGEQYLLCNQCATPGSLKAGDTLLGQYRLESLDANQAVFTYLPLMQRQSLMLESL